MFDFNKYDDVALIKDYDGFIDKYGNFYKVCSRMKKTFEDSHNAWAKEFIREKLNVKEFKYNPTTSALFTLTTLNGPAEILIHCFGFVYYSHDAVFHKPIIKAPDPKIANYKINEYQLDMLTSILLRNREDINILMSFEEDEYDYCGSESKVYKKELKK